MTIEAFIEFLCEEKINFSMNFMKDGSAAIYVHGAPKKIVDFYGNEMTYTPYLRFSHFNEKPGMIYVRDNGLCDYHTDEWCKAACIDYRDSFKEE